jgi:hypothetical protein
LSGCGQGNSSPRRRANKTMEPLASWSIAAKRGCEHGHRRRRYRLEVGDEEAGCTPSPRPRGFAGVSRPHLRYLHRGK